MEVVVRGRMHSRRSLVAACCAVVALVASAAASCVDDEPGAGQDPTQRLVEIYSVAVTEIADDAPTAAPEEGGEDKKRNVYLRASDETEITAEVQVGVVNDLDEWANVRFIDDMEEAVDLEADGAPVRDDGILIGLGEVSEGEVSAMLTADRYVSDSSIVVYEVALQRRSGEWTVEEPLDGVSLRTP
jgi:hypothetical protein